MVVRALIHEPIRDLRRAGEIVRLVAAHGFGYLLHRERIPEIEVPEDSPAALGKPTEERLRELLEALGPTFIKLGQILSTRPDVLPPAMAHALKALQDGALPVPLEDIHAQIRAELGRPAQDLFLEFDPDPIASASIAQVHRARLDTETGPRDVVIKVQRPGIHDQMLADLSLLRWLAWVLEGTIEEVSAYSPSAVVEQFELALKEELDFQHEMSNLLRARANFAERPDLLVVPEPFPDVSSGRVIVMACLDGCKVTAAKEADPHGLASRVVDVTFKQIFEDGFFHGDPHPGNILVLSDGRIGMIDYGVWGRLTRPQQDVLVELLMAIVFKSPPILARLAFRVGKPPASFDREAFEGEVGSLMDRYVGVELNQVSAGSLIGDAVDVIRRHRIQIPPEFALLLRATATLEGDRTANPRRKTGVGDSRRRRPALCFGADTSPKSSSRMGRPDPFAGGFGDLYFRHRRLGPDLSFPKRPAPYSTAHVPPTQPDLGSCSTLRRRSMGPIARHFWPFVAAPNEVEDAARITSP